MPRLSLILSLLLVFPLPAMAGEATLPLPLTARGNEPGWSVTLTAEGSSFTDMEGAALEAPFAPPRHSEGKWIIDTAGGELELLPTICRDAMTGMPHPFAARLQRAEAALSGCAGDPASLLAGDWVATELGGAALPDDAGVTLSVEAGRIAGRAACNRFSGSLMLTGEGLTFGPVAATRMACPAPQMQRESAVFAALAAVAAFDIDDDGHLVLKGADGSVQMRARR